MTDPAAEPAPGQRRKPQGAPTISCRWQHASLLPAVTRVFFERWTQPALRGCSETAGWPMRGERGPNPLCRASRSRPFCPVSRKSHSPRDTPLRGLADGFAETKGRPLLRDHVRAIVHGHNAYSRARRQNQTGANWATRLTRHRRDIISRLSLVGRTAGLPILCRGRRGCPLMSGIS
jgi:hypothetical protein